MTKVRVFGELKIMRANPWAKAGMSDKAYYLADPQSWVIDKARASPAQKKVWNAFTEVAKSSIEEFPADGSFATLQKRVKWIGSRLRGKTYTTVEKLRRRLPKSATADHPLRRRIEELAGAVAE